MLPRVEFDVRVRPILEGSHRGQVAECAAVEDERRGRQVRAHKPLDPG